MIDFLETELRPARYMVVAFTGVMHALGGIPFEFHRSLGQIDCAALFVRDLGKQWYQYGEADIRAAADRINAAIEASGAERIVFLGNSMGGFGALLFGARCGADAMVGFAAQTVIDPLVTSAIGDTRWAYFQNDIRAYPCGDLTKIDAPRGRVTLCYGADEPLDAVHVDRLAAAWQVERLIVENCAHDVASRLRENGKLVPLISKLLLGEGPAAQ